jgi:predicted amidophosphoribosyltransferase
MYGIREEKDSNGKINCARCKYDNLPYASYCNNCGLPLHTKAAIAIEET